MEPGETSHRKQALEGMLDIFTPRYQEVNDSLYTCWLTRCQMSLYTYVYGSHSLLVMNSCLLYFTKDKLEVQKLSSFPKKTGYSLVGLGFEPTKSDLSSLKFRLSLITYCSVSCLFRVCTQ